MVVQFVAWHCYTSTLLLRLASLWEPVPWNLHLETFRWCDSICAHHGSLVCFLFEKYIVRVVYWHSVFTFPGPWNSKALDQPLDFHWLGNFLHCDFPWLVLGCRKQCYPAGFDPAETLTSRGCVRGVGTLLFGDGQKRGLAARLVCLG